MYGLGIQRFTNKPSLDVFGEEVPFLKKEVVLFKPGKNIRIQDGKIFSL